MTTVQTNPYEFLQPLQSQSLPLSQVDLVDPYDVIGYQPPAGLNFLQETQVPQLTASLPTAVTTPQVGGFQLGNLGAGIQQGYQFVQGLGNKIGSGMATVGNQIAKYGQQLGSDAKNNFEQLDALGQLKFMTDTIQNFMGAYNTNRATRMQEKYYKNSMNLANKNYEANKTLTNEKLSDRQRRRIERNAGAQSESSYMAQWGVK